MRLSPLGPDAFWLEHYLSQAYYLIGRYEDAVGWGRMSAAHAGANTSNLRSLDREPRCDWARWTRLARSLSVYCSWCRRFD